MKFSIIIAVYNVERYLEACLESVLNQTFDDYEVVAVNDGSTDGSLNILRNYEDRFNRLIVIDSENGGPASARNIGLEIAQGEYVWFVDSDDWIERNALEVLEKKMKGEDMICFSGSLFYEDTKRQLGDEPLPETQMTGWKYYEEYALKPRHFHFVCVVLRLYKRSFLLDNSLTFEKNIFHEDNLFTPVVCFHARSVRLISDCLYVYRIRQGSITYRLSAKRLNDIITVANKLSDFFIAIQEIDKTVVYKEIAGEYFSVFMPEVHKLHLVGDKELKRNINWKNYKAVSVYARHRRIFYLLRLHPALFRGYLSIENWVKREKKAWLDGRKAMHKE